MHEEQAGSRYRSILHRMGRIDRIDRIISCCCRESSRGRSTVQPKSHPNYPTHPVTFERYSLGSRLYMLPPLSQRGRAGGGGRLLEKRSDFHISTSSSNRMLYIDNLRLAIIVIVVMVHFAITYSGIGGWYYVEVHHLDLASQLFFGFFHMFTQSYFMGVLFLISGYFVQRSYARKGIRRFIADRLLRLGIPILLYTLVLNPFILYYLLDLSWIRPKPSLAAFYLAISPRAMRLPATVRSGLRWPCSSFRCSMPACAGRWEKPGNTGAAAAHDAAHPGDHPAHHRRFLPGAPGTAYRDEYRQFAALLFFAVYRPLHRRYHGGAFGVV